PFEDVVGNTHLTVRGQFEGRFDNGGLDLRVHAVPEQRPVVRNKMKAGRTFNIRNLGFLTALAVGRQLF
ncbi:MAG: hypothetical protein PPHERAN_6366, partial [uncultured Paraburkholderia sp.]